MTTEINTKKKCQIYGECVQAASSWKQLKVNIKMNTTSSNLHPKTQLGSYLIFSFLKLIIFFIVESQALPGGGDDDDVYQLCYVVHNSLPAFLYLDHQMELFVPYTSLVHFFV